MSINLKLKNPIPAQLNKCRFTLESDFFDFPVLFFFVQARNISWALRGGGCSSPHSQPHFFFYIQQNWIMMKLAPNFLGEPKNIE